MTYLFAWQPALVDGLANGLFVDGDATSAMVHELTGLTTSGTAMTERIRWASTYIDDARWSDTISAELGLPVSLTTRGFAAKFGATLSVGSGIDLLNDPRLVEIVRRAIAYRGTDGCIVESGANRLSIQLNDVFGARVNGVMVDSDDVITVPRLDAMAASGAAFSELIWAPSEAAS